MRHRCIHVKRWCGLGRSSADAISKPPKLATAAVDSQIARVWILQGSVIGSLWPPCAADAGIIFLPCVFFFLSFFSSPNVSRRRLDVCHTSIRGVALVRIQDAGLKRAARGSLKCRTQNRHLRSIVQLCRAISLQLRHVSTIGKKTC